MLHDLQIRDINLKKRKANEKIKYRRKIRFQREHYVTRSKRNICSLFVQVNSYVCNTLMQSLLQLRTTFKRFEYRTVA